MTASKNLLIAALAMLLLALPASAAPQLDRDGSRADALPGVVNHSAAPDRLAPQSDPTDPDYYIVTLTAPALARYRGGIEDFVPTSPAATGERRLMPNSVIPSDKLAKAMLEVGLHGSVAHEGPVIENKDIRRLVGLA